MYKNYYENLPSGWASVLFSNFTLFTSDYVANGSFSSLKENVKFYKEKNCALLVKTQDFSNGFKSDLTYTDEHGYLFLSKCHLFGSEIIMSNIGASIGKVFIMPKLEIPCALAPNSILVKCYDDITTYFLKFYIMSNHGQNLLKSFTEGTAMPKFSKTQIRNAFIPVPPYYEQKKIVNKTKSLFTIINFILD